MTSVVTNIFISPKCPKYLQPIGEEFRKALNYAFADDESLSRFSDGCRHLAQQLSKSKKSSVRFDHTDHDAGGCLVIGKNDFQTCDYLRLCYVKVRGHVHVSKDGQKLYPQDFIKEEENI